MDKQFVEDHQLELEYLFELQQSGRTNMYGAATYLQSEMGLDKNEAREILQFWMANFEAVAKELGIEI
jgi:predicted ATPase